MTLATTTTPGQIQLAGSLSGNNNGASPELSHTGVVAGTYLLPNLTINSEGRITSASNSTGASLIPVLPIATNSTLGMIKVGSGLAINGSGVLSVVDATTSTKGIVQVGSGLLVSSGVLSIDTTYVNANLVNATTSIKGVVQVGTNIDVTSGVISVPNATTSSKGVVQAGTNINVTSGVISVPDATTSSKGVVQVGTNIDVTSGVISVAKATNPTLGVVKSADTNNITIDANGGINLGTNVAKLNTTNLFSASQRATPVVMSDSGTHLTVDASLGNVFTVTLTGNRTISNPINTNGCQRYTLLIKQGGSGSYTITWGSAYKFPTGASTTLSTAVGSVDAVVAISDGTSLFCNVVKGF